MNDPSGLPPRRRPAAGLLLCLAAPLLVGCVTSGIRAPKAGDPPAPTPGPIPRATGMRLVPTDPAPTPVVSIRRVEDPQLAAEFNNLRVGGDLYFGGWPTEAGLRALAAEGVRKVICLKTADEVMAARGYDPRKVASEIGITFVELPVSADSLSDAYIAKFASEIDRDEGGKTLVHCGAGGTCGMVWGSYLASRKGLDPVAALEQARAAGLLDGPQADAAARYVEGVEARRRSARDAATSPAGPAAPQP